MGVMFQSDDYALVMMFNSALQGLQQNVARVYGYENLILKEGAEYSGIWLECGPHEGAVYGMIDPQIALENHRIFFRLQREDGYVPCWIRADRIGSGQIQMVVPLAATAYEVYEQTGDLQFLGEAYQACTKWDAWLMRYRNTRGTGLCELFCAYDTGHDNSPRVANLPLECPDGDARLCPALPQLPYLAPDLSATLYGGRLALAKMAQALGYKDEVGRWEAQAEQIRKALMTYCFDPDDLCFYDRDSQQRLLRIRGDALLRVLGEHVVDQNLFEQIYQRHIKNPDEFWTPYPFPSIAVNDPLFVHEMPHNSWGGASQGLTALRVPRWLEYYGKHADLTSIMQSWIQALMMTKGFRQQMNPWSGTFTTQGRDYSPTMLVALDFITRLHGVRRAVDTLIWTCLPPEDSLWSVYRLDTPHGRATLSLNRKLAVLSLAGTQIAQVQGPCRVVTDLRGRVCQVIGIVQDTVTVTISRPETTALQLHVPPDDVLAVL